MTLHKSFRVQGGAVYFLVWNELEFAMYVIAFIIQYLSQYDDVLFLINESNKKVDVLN